MADTYGSGPYAARRGGSNPPLPNINMKKKLSKNIKTILAILQDEVNGNIKSALNKITKDYSMTWVDLGINGKTLFPSTGKNIKKELEEVYPIRGRQYDIRNITEGNNVVMVELIESFPNQKTKKVYRTPLVLVLEIQNNKIRTGRHYLDPKISQKHLSKKQIEKAYKNSRGSKLIIK